jgi:hypothetical protein
VSPFAVLFAAFAALLFARQQRRRRMPARVKVSPRTSTVIAADGAVRSVQSADITMARADLDRMWTPINLENLARTYWRFLTRVTLGLIRVVYGNNARMVVLLGRPLTLLRFKAPEYSLEDGHGNVRWQIQGGLLVARAGRGCGFLSLDVRRAPDDPASGQAKLHIEVEVANFYPAIAAGFSTPVYEATQSVIHVLVTHAFLRSLGNLDLAHSKIGRLSIVSPEAPGPPPLEPDAPAAEAVTRSARQ